jgi:hypothetical protein
MVKIFQCVLSGGVKNVVEPQPRVSKFLKSTEKGYV